MALAREHRQKPGMGMPPRPSTSSFRDEGNPPSRREYGYKRKRPWRPEYGHYRSRLREENTDIVEDKCRRLYMANTDCNLLTLFVNHAATRPTHTLTPPPPAPAPPPPPHASLFSDKPSLCRCAAAPVEYTGALQSCLFASAAP